MNGTAAETDAIIAAARAHRDAGRWQQAIEQFRRAIEREPGDPALFVELGECYRRIGDFGRTVHAFERAIALDPEGFAAYRSAADAALAEAERAGAGSKAGNDLRKFAGMYLVALGGRQQRQFLDAAEASFREAIALDAKSAAAHAGLGEFLHSRGRYAEAEKPLRRALALDRNSAAAHIALGKVLQSLGRFPEMEVAYRKALDLDPGLRTVRESLASIPLLNALYEDDVSAAEIFARHRAWGDAVIAGAAAAAARAQPFANKREPERRLRVGYASGDFRYHSVSFFFQPLLAHHDPAMQEVFCYADIERPDSITDLLRGIGGTWRNTHALDDEAFRAQLRADGIDVLVDLAGHSGANRLHAMAVKPAPVTASWLGYPATTGLATIDWRITDARADPDGQERFYAERLWRLPDVFACYNLYLEAPPEVAPVPAIEAGRITFGSFNNPQKISPSTIAAWARVLAAVPGSRLMLKSIAFIEPILQRRWRDRFAAAGIARERIDLRPPQRDPWSHLRSYAEVDVALDPFPYNGTTTTCEAMWMGVPVVSLIGERHSARVGFDLLSAAGLPELAAPDLDRYVDVAAALAQDLPRLALLRAGLRERMQSSPLCDAPRFARAFEAALRSMWRDWCRGGTAPPPGAY